MADTLDVVIVHQGLRKSFKDGKDVALPDRECLCKNQNLSSKLNSEPRKRHNATQTPTSLVNWDQRPLEHRNTSKHVCCNHKCKTRRLALSSCVCYGRPDVQVQTCHCHHLTTSTSHCCHCQSCKQHRHHQRSRSTDYKRHRDFQNHWAPLCAKDRSFRRKPRRCTSDRHRQYQRHKTECTSVGHLPNTCTKSSLDSSDDPKHPQNHRLSSSTALHEIAIEIDAATMTEDNTTTATSNFAFKAAAENAVVPIIRAPLHVDSEAENRARRLKRRSSNNSNTTAETDELSTEEHEDNCYRRQESYRCHCDHCHCCDDSEPKLQRSLVQMRNECVKIKRKRFIEADDYCSSCSRCSSCSCSHIHTSSCSSFEEWHLDERQSTRSAPNSHAFTVSADCHHCNPQRRPIVSSTCDMGQEDRHYTGDEVLPQPLIHETSDSSGHTSRRSSVSASFCSCTSNTCCCCDDSTTGQMCTARDVTLTTSIVGKLTCTDGEEQHSSTLTPLTNPSSVVSTPVGDDGEVTIRSFSQALTDDTSSQSHSADYYSLSSNQQQTLDTPCKTPILLANLSTDQNVPNVEVIDTVLEADDPARKARRQCKHFSKHHRHKRPDSPTDSYL